LINYSPSYNISKIQKWDSGGNCRGEWRYSECCLVGAYSKRNGMFTRSELERLTVAGLKSVAAQQKLETRGMRAELLDRLADHFERRGWSARLLGEAEMSEERMENATTEAVEGQTIIEAF